MSAKQFGIFMFIFSALMAGAVTYDRKLRAEDEARFNHNTERLIDVSDRTRSACEHAERVCGAR